MPKLPNIALIGKLRSGKDSVADYLTDNYGYMRFAFGDDVKRVCRQLFPEAFIGGAKPRALLQGVGQDLRKYDSDIWIKQTFARIEERHHFLGGISPIDVVISDVRQPNEVEALKEAGYVLIRIECPESIRIERAIASGDVFNLVDLVHNTETALDGYEADYTIVNDGTLAELYAKIDAVIMR